MAKANLQQTFLNFDDGTGNNTAELRRNTGDLDIIVNLDSVTNLANPIKCGMVSSNPGVGTLAHIFNVADPVHPQDGATKNYVDSIATVGVVWKAVCQCATTGPIVLDPAPGTIDGSTLTGADNRVLVKDQASASENGIYIDNGSGNLVRASDMPIGVSAVHNATFIREGTVNIGMGYLQTADPCIIATTAQTWIAFTISDVGDMKVNVENIMTAGLGKVHYPDTATSSWGGANYGVRMASIESAGTTVTWATRGGSNADLVITTENTEPTRFTSTFDDDSANCSVIMAGGLSTAGIIYSLNTDTASNTTGSAIFDGGVLIKDNVFVINTATVGGFFVVSDKRLKKNIKPMDSSISSKLYSLEPKEYKWKTGDSKTHIGFIAQDVEAILPDLVQETNDDMKSINYIEMIPLLVKEMQILRKEVTMLRELVGVSGDDKIAERKVRKVRR